MGYIEDGAHLSFVRSVNLDEWTEKQYKKMKEWGNLNANAYFEARLDKKKPDQHASVNEMNRYIRDKYEMGKWVPDGGRGRSETRRGAGPVAARRRAGADARAPQSCEAARQGLEPLEARSPRRRRRPTCYRSTRGSRPRARPSRPSARRPPQQQAPFEAFGTQATRAAPSSILRRVCERAGRAAAAARAAAGVERRDPLHVQRAAGDAARRAHARRLPDAAGAVDAAAGRRPWVLRSAAAPDGLRPAADDAAAAGLRGLRSGAAAADQQQQGMMMARQMQQPMGFPPQQQHGDGLRARPPMPPQQNFGGMGMMGGGSMPSPMMSPPRGVLDVAAGHVLFFSRVL